MGGICATLLALLKVRRKDGGSANPFSGFRTAGVLAGIYESIDPGNITGAPTAQALTAYVSQIHARINAVTPPGRGPLRPSRASAARVSG